MLLAPLGPRGKLRPGWAFGTGLREHSLAAGTGPGDQTARPAALTLVLRLRSVLVAVPVRSSQRVPWALHQTPVVVCVSQSVSERLLCASRSGNASGFDGFGTDGRNMSTRRHHRIPLKGNRRRRDAGWLRP